MPDYAYSAMSDFTYHIIYKCMLLLQIHNVSMYTNYKIEHSLYVFDPQ